MSIKTSIETYTGTIASEPVQEYFIDSLKAIVTSIASLRPDLLTLFGKTSSVDSAGVPITGNILDVEYNGEMCRNVAASMRKKLDEPNSIYATTSNDPAYYILGNKVFVSPDPGSPTLVDISSGNITAHADGAKIAETGHGLSVGDLIIISGTTGAKSKYLNGDWRVITEIDNDNFTIAANHTAYSADWDDSNTAYMRPEATLIQTAIDYAVDVTTDEVGNIDYFPEELSYLPVYHTAANILNKKLFELSLPSTPTMPIPPSPPSLDSPSENLPSFTEPLPFTLPVVPDDLDIDISGFTAPSLSMPTSIVDPNFSTGATSSPVSAPNYTNLTLDIESIDGSSDDTTFEGIFDRALQFSKEGDTEEASGVTAALNTYLSGVQAKISDNAAQMQADVTHYQAQAQALTATATNLLQSEVQEYANQLNKYSQEVNAAVGAFGQEMAKWSAEVSNVVQIESSEAQDKLTKYQALIAAETQAYSSSLQTENTKYQSLSKSYALELQKISQANQETLSVYNAAIQIYGAEASNGLQLYTANITGYSTDLQRIGQSLAHVTGLIQDGMKTLVANQLSQPKE